jgi:putative ABC transport system permease protein
VRRLWSSVRSRLGFLLRRSRVEREMDDELRFHLAECAADLVRRGVSAPEAARRARLAFGGVDRTKEGCREAIGVALVDTVGRDLRYGARMLCREPGWTAVAVLTLALGIGANAAIFSAVDALLLRELPVRDLDRLVFAITMREGFDPFGMSILEFAAIRERNHVFSRTTVAEQRSFNLTGRDFPEPQRIPGAAVQADFLSTLGVEPVLGRGFEVAEDRPGGPNVALLGHDLWRRRFGGDPQLVGRALTLNGRSTTVIGILPPAFDYPNQAEIWIPLQTRLSGLPMVELAAHRFGMVAHLRPGVAVEQAEAELLAIGRELER